jgi:hypothetical protein
MQVFQDVRDEGSSEEGSSASSSPSSSGRQPRPYLRQLSDVRSYLQRSGRSDVSDELTRQLMWPASVTAALPAALLEEGAQEEEDAAADAGSSGEPMASATSAPWQYYHWQSCHTRVQHGKKARSRGFSMRSSVAHELLPDQRGGAAAGQPCCLHAVSTVVLRQGAGAARCRTTAYAHCLVQQQCSRSATAAVLKVCYSSSAQGPAAARPAPLTCTPDMHP